MELNRRYPLKLIDIKYNKECWFRCINNHSIFYKNPIQIIKDPFIIEQLNSLDSCLVGVICGETYKERYKEGLILPKSSFHQNKLDYVNKFKLVLIDRQKNVRFTDLNNKLFELNVLELAQDKNIINNFTSLDSYYIGFIAGLELFRMKNNFHTSQPPLPSLKLISCR